MTPAMVQTVAALLVKLESAGLYVELRDSESFDIELTDDRASEFLPLVSKHGPEIRELLLESYLQAREAIERIQGRGRSRRG